MADDAKVVLVVLGGEHDLSDNLKRLDAKCRYVRVKTMGYEEAAK
jgi:hypothetical protein